MGIENLLAQGVQIRPQGMEANALMQYQQFQDAKLKNALLQTQMQDMHAQRQMQQQQLAEALRRQAAQQSIFGRIQRGEKVDPAESLAAGIDPKQIEFLANKDTLGMPKVARTMEVAGPGGLPQTVQVDDFGRPVGQAFNKPVEQKLVNTGGSQVAYNPYTISGSIINTQSPDSKASTGLGYARLNFDKQQAQGQVKYEQDVNGNYVALPTRLGAGEVPRAQAVMAPGGVTPLQGNGKGMTEDQGKATGWLVQADNAWKNMQNIIATKPGAQKPGFGDAVANVPLLGGVGNWMRSADRQQFLQGASSLSEALLRAATGAGVNKDEAKQKIQEITPQWGDSDEVIAQKTASIPLYLESLKVRAGPGANKAAAIAPAATQKAAQHATVRNDAEYNSLPSGATFIAPDGSIRRKP